MALYRVMPNMFQRLVWMPVRLAMRALAHLEVRGTEHLTAVEGNVIFACNHTNQFDPILLVACLPFSSRHLPLIFASREKAFYSPKGWENLIYGGTFFRLMGAYPMYGGLRDYEAALRHHIIFLRSGQSICIFPTGKIDRGMSRPARGGVGYLVHATGVPVIPVCIRGVEDMSWRSVWSGRHRIAVTFGSPMRMRDCFPDSDTSALVSGQNPFAAAAARIMERVEIVG